MPKATEPPIVSRTIDDIDTPGVVVEVDQDEAEQWGAFTEDAIDFDAALESNVEVGS